MKDRNHIRMAELLFLAFVVQEIKRQLCLNTTA